MLLTYVEALGSQSTYVQQNVSYSATLNSRHKTSIGIIVKPKDSNNISSNDVEEIVKKKFNLVKINVGVSKIRKIQKFWHLHFKSENRRL